MMFLKSKTRKTSRISKLSKLLRQPSLSVSKLVQSLFYLFLVQAGTGFPFGPAAVDTEYVRMFLEPDAETYKNGPISSMTWHVKETLQVMKIWGLTGEEHEITTEDGYILSLFRVTPRTNNSTPVLFLHGFLAAPETWLMRGKEDLVNILMDNNYDVWLASYRGSYYGRRHVTLSNEDEKFWDFSFHEHALYDIPATIDHILTVTESRQVSAIAHSMGNAVFMAMLALQPQYNDKVALFVGMAPYAVTRMMFGRLLRPTIVPLVKLNQNTKESGDLLVRRKINPLVGICSIAPFTCNTLMQFTQGPDFMNIDLKLMLVLLSYFPSGSSDKNLEHLIQIGNGKFRQYDYGLRGNLANYGHPRPPDYNLSDVRVPVTLYFGKMDRAVPIWSMEAQVRALPNVVRARRLPGYNHADFIMGKNTRKVIYNSIVEDLGKYTGQDDQSL